MSLRLDRLWLILGLFLAGEAYALGLGEIRLNSALNEPLNARIELVSATPEDLAELEVALASADTFERYGLYRPLYLTRLQFTVVRSGRPDGNAILVRSNEPITEPFVTFLVEASWPRGRLLREYTVLLDPPTFAPPPASRASEAVTAPSRAAPADSGRIERPAAAEPAAAAAAERPPMSRAPFDTAPGGDVQVQRGDTLWGIAERVRPDARVSMNQTMLAIYEANPQAFAGNINLLHAGAMLRVPSADEIFRISRLDAVSEVQRQNAAFGGARAEPRLTLVPPDADAGDYRAGGPGGSSAATDGPSAERIRELERTIEEQQSLIDVRDEELARLREELARVREQAAAAAQAQAAEPAAETAEPPPAVDEGDRVFADDSAAPTGEEAAAEEEAAADGPAGEAAPAPTPAPERVQPAAADEPGLVDRIVGALTGFWGMLGLGLLVVLGVLLWLAKRAAGGGREEESTGVWDALDAGEELDSETLASTERLRALARDEDSSIVVVEQERTAAEQRGRAKPAATETDSTAATGTQPAIEDTISTETAINLDQSDPIAEADFHMAYGLYDQAADLINGALAVEPERQDLMAKLCEIYFVWGNRDAFVDAAERLHDQLGGESSPDWDKIVIMGRQIAAEHKLFAGASAGGATRAVDLTLDSEEGGALDMDFAGGPDGPVSDIVDLSGGGDEAKERSGIDFLFDDETDTGASTTRAMPPREDMEETAESPTMEAETSDERTVESPTIEQPFDSLDNTAEIRPRKETSAEATAEIDLDDLGLDLDDLAASGRGNLDDESDSGYADLDATAESGVLAANDDDDDATGRNPSLDESLAATGEMPSLDEATGKNPAFADTDEHADTDVDFETTLLDATGHTQVLPDDSSADREGDDDQTMLAPVNDDDYEATAALSDDDLDVDFDFAKTEALPKGSFDAQDRTGEMPKISGESDLDLDLDDLTAALRGTDGDTVDQPRDDATVERPRVTGQDMVDLDLGDLGDTVDETPTEALSPEEFSDDLHDARTMTEVGTKLDLARAYVDMGDPDGARSILEEVLEEGDDGQRQQARKLIETLPA